MAVATDYEAISRENIRRRGEEFDDIGQFVAEQLYSDRGHFIFELLQNAEDTGATRVVFTLRPTELEFRHYGGRPFDEDDVKAITDILRGTKKEDPTKIGKFGIGFKSVFAFTSSPEIYSGDERFRIERYIRPREIPAVALQTDETRIRFPFDHATLKPEDAHELIAERLSALDLRALLFLKSIGVLDYEIESLGAIGTYRRHDDVVSGLDLRRLRGTSTRQDGPDREESWLVFERAVHRPDGVAARPVSVAYRLREEEDGRRRVVAEPGASLAVTFPTGQPTDAGLAINGPYVTTSARDNVLRDESWNTELVLATGALLAESLTMLRESGLLSVGALEALPIRAPDSASYMTGFLRPLHDSVCEALRREELLPALTGGYVTADEAMLARGSELRDLLSDAQVGEIFEAPGARWLTEEITSDRTRALRDFLVDELRVPEVDPEAFAGRLSGEFLACQTDEWLSRLYAFLGTVRALWRPAEGRWAVEGVIRKRPILRLEDDSQIAPFRSDGAPAAFLPSATRTHFPTIKQAVTNEGKALQFLRDLGLTEPDIVDELLEYVLPKYTPVVREAKSVLPDPVSEEENLADIRTALQALDASTDEKNERLRRALTDAYFLRGASFATGEVAWCRLDRVYLLGDEDGMRHYFEGNPRARYLLANELTAHERSKLSALGLAQHPRITKREPRWDGQVILADHHGWHQRGLDAFDPDATIDGLVEALAHPTVERSRYVWNRLLGPNAALIRGTVESSTRQTFESATREERLSPIGQQATSAAWVPTKDGSFRKPEELSFDDLPDGFDPDMRLCEALRMQRPDDIEAAKSLGLGPDEARFLKDNLSEFREWVREQREQRLSAATPDSADINYSEEFKTAFARSQGLPDHEEQSGGGAVRDPKTYQQRVSEDLHSAKEREPSRDERFRRVPRKVWEAKDGEVRAFLREEYGGRCQICSETFHRRDGEPYFEGVYVVSRTGARWLDNAGNVLCLCANCTAKFEHGSVEADDVLERVMNLRPSAGGGDGDLSFAVRLCGDDVDLRFTERHLLRLQALLKPGTQE